MEIIPSVAFSVYFIFSSFFLCGGVKMREVQWQCWLRIIGHLQSCLTVALLQPNPSLNHMPLLAGFLKGAPKICYFAWLLDCWLSVSHWHSAIPRHFSQIATQIATRTGEPQGWTLFCAATSRCGWDSSYTSSPHPTSFLVPDMSCVLWSEDKANKGIEPQQRGWGE